MKLVITFKETTQNVRVLCRAIKGTLKENKCKVEMYNEENNIPYLDPSKFKDLGEKPRKLDISLLREFGVKELREFINNNPIDIVRVDGDSRGSVGWGKQMQEHPKVKMAQQIFKEAKGNPEKIKEYWKNQI